MQQVPCNFCGSLSFKKIFRKKSSLNEWFVVAKCNQCGLVQVNPQPSLDEVMKYYSNDYFTRRTDRGYDNYYAEHTRQEIARVFQLNLDDLNFFSYFGNRKPSRRSLDIGCAAGYFVDYMKRSSWDASGIEIAPDPAAYAVDVLGLNVYRENFLDWDSGFQQKFDLITLWATIEHLHQPKETIHKAVKHLEPGGMLILSTCRYGLLARLRGIHWRYMNVPEHLYYISLPALIGLGEEEGLKTYKHVTYGSGMTGKKNASFLYKKSKSILDWLVKATDQGDMMAVAFIKAET